MLLLFMPVNVLFLNILRIRRAQSKNKKLGMDEKGIKTLA